MIFNRDPVSILGIPVAPEDLVFALKPICLTPLAQPSVHALDEAENVPILKSTREVREGAARAPWWRMRGSINSLRRRL